MEAFVTRVVLAVNEKINTNHEGGTTKRKCCAVLHSFLWCSVLKGKEKWGVEGMDSIEELVCTRSSAGVACVQLD